MSVALYPHNKEIYDKITNRFDDENLNHVNRTCVVQPTGSGKSYLYMKWIEDNILDRILMLSPSTEILDQFRDEAGKNDPMLLRNTTLFTYSKLSVLSDDDIKNISVDRIIVDEFHRAGANKWSIAFNKLLSLNPDVKVLGGTATPIRYLDSFRDMTKEIFNGDIVNYMSLGEAIVKGVLPEFEYVPVWYEDGSNILVQYQQDIENGLYESNKLVEERIDRIKKSLHNAFGIEDIIKDNIESTSGKYIVFCRNYEHLLEIKEVVATWFSKITNLVKVYQSTIHNEDRSKQYQEFKSDSYSDHIKILLVIDRLNEGVHPKGINGIFMLRPTTSPIIYLQQLGRALASGNNKLIVFDMVNNFLNMRAIKCCNGCSILEYEVREACSDQEQAEDILFRIFRKAYSYIELVDELEEVLNMSGYDIRWHEIYEYLKENVVDGNFIICSKMEYMGVNLGHWITLQRMYYRSGTLDDIKINLLKDIGLDITISADDLNWNIHISNLKMFLSEYNRPPRTDDNYNNLKLGVWFIKLKQLMEDEDFSLDRKNELMEIEKEYNISIKDPQWVYMFNIVKEFVNLHDGFPKSNVVYHDLPIGQRFYTQVFYYNRLSADRQNLLNSLGYELSKEENFDESFFNKCMVLVDFIDKNGRKPMFDEEHDGVKIGSWWADQRKYIVFPKKKGYKLRTLEKYIDLSDVNSYDDSWSFKFGILEDYYNEFRSKPSSNTEYKGCKLGSWFYNQIYRKKIGDLDDTRYNLLCGLYPEVFCNYESGEDKNNRIWFENLSVLKECIEVTGKIPVSTTEFNGVKIGRWLYRQLRNIDDIKKDIIKYNALIEVIPDVNHGTVKDQWNYMFDTLLQYKDEYGTFPNNKTVYNGTNLGTWYVTQRKSMRKVTDKNREHVELLKSIGVSTSKTNKEIWYDTYDKVKSFICENGRLPGKDNDYESNLRSWIYTQRSKYNRGLLNEEYIPLIMELGII